MDYTLHLNEFFVEGGKQELSHVLLHITEPSTPEEKNKGYFFALCEISHAEPKYIAKLQEIIDTIENRYYETPNTPEKQALEIVLEQANPNAFTLVRPEVNLNCVIGVIREPEISFAYYGTPQMLLFYKQRDGSYQRMNLIEDDGSGTGTNQLFSQLVQGKLTANDYLFIGTPQITQYFSGDRLEKIITSRPARQSAEHLERVLSELKNGFSFGGLVLQLTPITTPEPVAKAAVIPPRNLAAPTSNIFSAEQRTAQTLAPPILPKVGTQLKDLLNPEKRIASSSAHTKPSVVSPSGSPHIRPHRSERPTTTAPSETSDHGNGLAALVRLFVYLGKGILWIFYTLYAIIYGIARNTALLFFVVSNYQNRRRLIVEEWRRHWKGFRENIRQLPLLTKVLFFGAIAAIVILVGSIIAVRYRQQSLAREQAFTSALNLIGTKKDAADSSLIYHNEAAAVAELQSAEAILHTLTCTQPEHQAACADMENQLQALLVRARKITVVQPQLLVDWSGLLNNQTPLDLFRINGVLTAFSNATTSLLSYDPTTNIQKINSVAVDAPGFSLAAVPKENDFALLMFNKNKAVLFTPNGTSTKMADIAYPNDNATIAAAVIYNRRLYALDSANKQIYKHDIIKTGFSQGKEWVKTPSGDLSKGQNLAVDGDLYVLQTDGHIYRYTSGVGQEVPIQGLDPALANGGYIWTYTDSNNLYILDPVGSRLILLDKQGNLIQQLSLRGLAKPTGLVVDEPNKTAYLTDSDKLYKIALP